MIRQASSAVVYVTSEFGPSPVQYSRCEVVTHTWGVSVEGSGGMTMYPWSSVRNVVVYNSNEREVA